MFEHFLDIFWKFFENLWKPLGNFSEGFFSRNFLEGFFGRVFLEEFFVYIGIDLFVKILSQWKEGGGGGGGRIRI